MGDSISGSEPLREKIAKRAGFTCEYCQTPEWLSPVRFEIDHITPRSLGGQTVLSNLCLACPECNSAKQAQTAALDPATQRRVRLFNPRRDDWDRHFRWSKDLGKVLGRTSRGRATVAALKMNPERIIALRRIWAGANLHPEQHS